MESDNEIGKQKKMNLDLEVPSVFDPALCTPEIEYIVDVNWIDHEGGENMANFGVRATNVRDALDIGIKRLYEKFGRMVIKIDGCTITGD